MQCTMLRIAVVVAALAAATQASQAQTPFGSRPFCASGDYGVGSLPQCIFNTWEQCRASLQGIEHCYANPALAWNRAHGAAAGKKTQRRQGKKRPRS